MSENAELRQLLEAARIEDAFTGKPTGELQLVPQSDEPSLFDLLSAAREEDLEAASLAEEESGFVSKTKAAVGGVAEGFVGLADFLGGITDFLPGGLEDVGRPKGGPSNVDKATDTARTGLSELGLSDERPVQDQPVSERLLRFTGEAAAASSPFAAGAIKLGKTVGEGGNIIRPLLRDAAKRPLPFIAGEAASVVGEAGGRVLAQEQAPGSTTAELIFGFSGAVLPGVLSGTARRIGEKSVGIANTLRPGSAGSTRAAREHVARVLQGEPGATGLERAKANIDRAKEIMEEIPGTEFSAAQAARDPGLIGLEKKQVASSRGLQLQLIEQQKHTEKAILAEVIARSPPGDKDAITALVNGNRIVLENSLQADLDAAVSNVAARIDTATVGLSPEDASEITMDLIQKESERLFAPIRANLDTIDRAAINSTETATRDILVSAVRDLKKTTSKAGKATGALPETLFDVIDSVTHRTDEAGQVVASNIPIFELRGLQETLRKQIKAINKSLDRTGFEKLPAMYELLDAVDNTLDNFIATSPGSKIAQDYATQLGAYKSVAKRFRTAITGRAITRQTNDLVEEATLAVYFKRGASGRKSMNKFVLAAKESPAARNMMTSYIVGQAIDATLGPDGLVNGRSLERFKKIHRAALSVDPAAASRIDNVLSLQRIVDDTIGSQKRSLAEFNQTQAALFSKRKPRAAVNGIIKAGNPRDQRRAARALMNEVRESSAAVAGIRNTFWDELFDRSQVFGPLPDGSQTEFLDPLRLARQVKKFGPAIEEIFGAGHLKNLQILSEAAVMAGIKAGAGTVSPQRAKRAFSAIFEGASFKAIYSRFYSPRVRSFRVGVAVLRVLRNLANLEMIDLMNEALANPALARTLMAEVTPDNELLILRRLRANLVSLGHRVDDEEQTP